MKSSEVPIAAAIERLKMELGKGMFLQLTPRSVSVRIQGQYHLLHDDRLCEPLDGERLDEALDAARVLADRLRELHGEPI